MYFAFLDITDSVTLFMERGGPVLNVIAMLLLVKWSLVFERIWYLNTTHKTNVKNTLACVWGIVGSRQAGCLSNVLPKCRREMQIMHIYAPTEVTEGGLRYFVNVCFSWARCEKIQ